MRALCWHGKNDTVRDSMSPSPEIEAPRDAIVKGDEHPRLGGL